MSDVTLLEALHAQAEEEFPPAAPDVKDTPPEDEPAPPADDPDDQPTPEPVAPDEVEEAVIE